MNNSIIILISLIGALLLSLIMFPIGNYAPDWMNLILVYWILAVPFSIGLITSWLIGLVADVAFGSVLGLNALTYTLISYIVIRSYKFIRYLTVYQQSFIILLLFMSKYTLIIWINTIFKNNNYDMSLYWAALTSAIAWPFVFYILRYIRRKYNIS